MAKNKNMIGAWAFLIGVLLAIIVGLLGNLNSTWIIILSVLGILVGLLNVGGQELKDFMLAGAVLVIVSTLAGQSLMLEVASIRIGSIFQALIVLFVPATIVVALKMVFALAKN